MQSTAFPEKRYGGINPDPRGRSHMPKLSLSLAVALSLLVAPMQARSKRKQPPYADALNLAADSRQRFESTL